MIRGSAIVGLTAAAGYALSLSTQPISADSPSSPSSNETVEQGLSDPSHRILPLTSASASDNSSTQTALSRTPLSALIRTYLVYTFTSLPLIVDYSPSILNALTRSPIPGVSAISEWIVRRTFFDQFVGGDDVKSCLPVMETLRQEEIGTMLVYSVEVEEHGDEAGHEIEGQGGKFKSPEARKEEEDKVRRATEERVEETLRCIRVAGDFERRMKARTGGLGFGGTYVAIKLVSWTVIGRFEGSFRPLWTMLI
jgi:proline dehydrogenase